MLSYRTFTAFPLIFSPPVSKVNLVAANNNKFYKLQLIEASDGCYQYVRYGRVGETGAQQVKGKSSRAGCLRHCSGHFRYTIAIHCVFAV